uniref:Uncharacterized protein n=1 Tax=Anguilla anguilla TaxID=7936 RepID=A0A0E9V6R0_ANGAN
MHYRLNSCCMYNRLQLSILYSQIDL